MQHTLRTPNLLWRALIVFALSLCLPVANVANAAGQRRKAKSRSSAGRTARQSNKPSASRSRGSNSRGGRAASRARSGRRGSSVARSANRPRRGKLSRRERAQLAAAERRRRIEAARRAELARQAAIARRRALDQLLRDEAVANILRDDTTGEDMEVRRVAIAALGSHAGTVVVMDPKTGRIYSVVNQDWALRRGFTPCSTIKLVTGLAGLAEKAIDPYETLNATGRYRLDLTDSLAFSNNTYFQSVGGRVGFDGIMNYARMMGLGERTGVNHPNEYTGRVPVFKSGYAVNHMCSHGDDFEVTPIQLATLASAIANGGKLLAPHLPRTPEETVDFKPVVRRTLNVTPEILRRLVPGMIGAVNYGTAKLAYDATQTVAGKTGTCTGQGSKLGLFTSYAPVDDPRLAIAVVTRGSGERGRTASEVAGKIYRGLNHRFGKKPGSTPQVATTPESLVPRTKVDSAGAAIVSDEDREADAEEANAGAATEAGATGAASTGEGVQQGGNVKSILKPIETKPTAQPTPARQQQQQNMPASTAPPSLQPVPTSGTPTSGTPTSGTPTPSVTTPSTTPAQSPPPPSSPTAAASPSTNEARPRRAQVSAPEQR